LVNIKIKFNFVVFFPLRDSPASELYVLMFQNTLLKLHSSSEQEEF